jgi:hypothetical protein
MSLVSRPVLLFLTSCPQSSARRAPRDLPSRLRLFHWARNLFSGRQSGVPIEQHEHRPAVVNVPYAKGKRVSNLLSRMSEYHLKSHRGTRQQERNAGLSRKRLLRAVHALQIVASHSNPAARLRLSHLRNHSMLSLRHQPHLWSSLQQLPALILM